MLTALPADLPDQVSRALREDIGSGDVTAALIPATQQAQARVLCREPAVLCGAAWFDETFRQLDPAVRVDWRIAEGARAPADSILCELTGPARPILTGERTALNFLQLLSATATVTQRYVEALAAHGLPHSRYAQDHPGSAQRAEICRALRRRRQSPHGPV